MSIELMTGVWARGPKNIHEMVILLALADNANDSGVCWPKIVTLASRGRMTTRQVYRVLDSLEDNGWVKRETRVVGADARRKATGSKSNRYTVNGDKLSRDGVSQSPSLRDTQSPTVRDPESPTKRDSQSPTETGAKKARMVTPSHAETVTPSHVHKESSGLITRSTKAKTPLPPASEGRKTWKASVRSPNRGLAAAKREAVQREARVGMHYPETAVTVAQFAALPSLDYGPTVDTKIEGRVDAMAWSMFALALKQEFNAMPTGSILDKRFGQLVEGVSDYESAMRGMWLIDSETDDLGNALIRLGADNPELTARAFKKYASRIQALMFKHFKFIPQVQFRAVDAA
jgi:hypothetical protein